MKRGVCWAKAALQILYLLVSFFKKKSSNIDPSYPGSCMTMPFGSCQLPVPVRYLSAYRIPFFFFPRFVFFILVTHRIQILINSNSRTFLDTASSFYKESSLQGIAAKTSRLFWKQQLPSAPPHKLSFSFPPFTTERRPFCRCNWPK